jgi:ATP-dependent helicase HrpB
MFPVETHYVAAPANTRIEQHVARTIMDALHDTEGGILAFLPGEGEIRTVERLLADNDLQGAALSPLYGNLPPETQDKAIRPRTDGSRKIVLATSIAETSLTIEDVRVVIDAGLQRLARYNPATGMTQLVTQRVSLASADQRRGRAGRVAPGICYRLWSEPETRSLAAYTPAEILTSDLAPFALELAAWGERDTTGLKLLDHPPKGTFAEAHELLRELDALDKEGRITPHGRACLTFGAHPRLAHMMIRGTELGLGATAATLAAVLSERDITRSRDTDLRTRLEIMSGRGDPQADRGAVARAREQARTWCRTLKVSGESIEPASAGRLAALAYPERVARRRGPASYRMANGRGAVLNEADPLSVEPFLAIASLDGAGANARVFQAAPLSLQDIEELFEQRIHVREKVEWNDRERIVVARQETVLDELVLSEKPLRNPSRDLMVAATLDGIRALGIACLPWTDELMALRQRLAFLRKIDPDAGWPDTSDEVLMSGIDEWLAAFLDGITRASDFSRIRLQDAMDTLLDWQARKRLDTMAPASITVPSGSSIRIDYSADEPVLAVRLQEMFGLADTPTIANGRAPLLLHLLSPARRPVQVTRDLRSFWKNAYPEVKKDLKGRYPKHHWPEDPWSATPTARAKPRGS